MQQCIRRRDRAAVPARPAAGREAKVANLASFVADTLQTVHGVPATNCSRKKAAGPTRPCGLSGKIECLRNDHFQPGWRRSFQNLAVTLSPEIMSESEHSGVWRPRYINARLREFRWPQLALLNMRER